MSETGPPGERETAGRAGIWVRDKECKREGGGRATAASRAAVCWSHPVNLRTDMKTPEPRKQAEPAPHQTPTTILLSFGGKLSSLFSSFPKSTTDPTRMPHGWAPHGHWGAPQLSSGNLQYERGIPSPPLSQHSLPLQAVCHSCRHRPFLTARLCAWAPEPAVGTHGALTQAFGNDQGI